MAVESYCTNCGKTAVYAGCIDTKRSMNLFDKRLSGEYINIWDCTYCAQRTFIDASLGESGNDGNFEREYMPGDPDPDNHIDLYMMGQVNIEAEHCMLVDEEYKQRCAEDLLIASLEAKLSPDMLEALRLTYVR